ncbi:MAG: hypothetical protein CML20_08655 [Rheinheimera sp.]|nr:hypothetical protein [Rheinheimera sp.]
MALASCLRDGIVAPASGFIGEGIKLGPYFHLLLSRWQMLIRDNQYFPVASDRSVNFTVNFGIKDVWASNITSQGQPVLLK